MNALRGAHGVRCLLGLPFLAELCWGRKHFELIAATLLFRRFQGDTEALELLE
jgi:hypothetical protein